MECVLVHPLPLGTPADGLRLLPGAGLLFGRGSPDSPVGLPLVHPEVPRRAGELRAVEDHWTLTNLSGDRTYVVENPEGGGEHIKVPPRRRAAPVPFEIARVVLPVTAGSAQFLVFAPSHTYVDLARPGAADGQDTTCGFALDETAKYFLVLVALCEPRLRDSSAAAVPTVAEVVQRLLPLPGCADLSRTSVNFHIDYLAQTKLRLREYDRERTCRLEWKRGALVSFALRFDLVREAHLGLLPPAAHR